jgi:penicillin-binding protein 1C
MRRAGIARRATLGLLLALLAAISWLLPRLSPAPRLRDGFPSSTALFDARGRLLRIAVADDDRLRLWTPLEEISPVLLSAVVAYEDRRFLRHPGVDPIALARAAASTYLRPGGRRVGGSTITMQLARRLHGLDSRGLGGKLAQIGRALLLELRYSKRELLEAYLNLVPMGGNVEGVGAASLVCFGKSASELAPAEAVTLSLIPQNPLRRGVAGEAARRRRAEARARLLAAGGGVLGLDATGLAQARVPVRLRAPSELPFEAPHLLDRFLAEGRRGAIRSTVDRELQRLARRQLLAQLERLRPLGVRQGAVLIADATTGTVRATIGSPDYRARAGGAVDGTRARRSPGSTLKPFVYGLALDAGLIHPRSLLADLPVVFGELRAENFDRAFLGPLPAEEALARSRNLPALALAAALPADALHALLGRAGVGGLRAPEHYGLALVLGAVELRLEELAALYAALASRGELRPLRTRLDEPRAPATRLLSPEASFVVLEMLRDGLGEVPSQGARSLGLAFKTGTSNGYHDAWAIGVAGEQVVAVWIGDVRGRGNPAFVGGSAAAPLLFAIVDALAAAGHRAPPRTPPPGVRRIEVCAASGALPTPDCPHRRATWFLPGRSPIATCRVHRRILVDSRSGERVCRPGARPGGRLRLELHEHWPSELEAAFRAAGLPRRAPPTGPGCEDVRGTGPRIRSPRARAYAPAPRFDRIALEASVDASAAELFWFVDDVLLGRARRGQTLLWRPERPGRYRVRVVDSAGRSDAREVEVEAAGAT